MTDLPDSPTAPSVRPARPSADGQGYRLEEAYWGYRIVPQGRLPLVPVLLQSVAMITGATFFAAAAVLALLAGPSEMMFRVPVIVVLGALGIALMWFASRGTAIQIEVDTINGEVREVVRNRTGAVTVLARYGFDCIGSVFIVRPEGRGPTLVLRYRNTARTLTVASGHEAALARLRDRVGRDLIVKREGV